MRPMRLCAVALASAGFLACASTAWASEPASVAAQFKKADAAFAGPLAKWSATMTASAPTLSRVKKADAAFVPAIKAFDTALGKIAFTGKTVHDIATLVKLNKQEIGVLANVTNMSGFMGGMEKLSPQFAAVQSALGKDLGIATGEVMV